MTWGEIVVQMVRLTVRAYFLHLSLHFSNASPPACELTCSSSLLPRHLPPAPASYIHLSVTACTYRTFLHRTSPYPPHHRHGTPNSSLSRISSSSRSSPAFLIT